MFKGYTGGLAQDSEPEVCVKLAPDQPVALRSDCFVYSWLRRRWWRAAPDCYGDVLVPIKLHSSTVQGSGKRRGGIRLESGPPLAASRR